MGEEGATASKGVAHHREDLHFDQVIQASQNQMHLLQLKIVNEIRDIQLTVDNLLFGSVFLRKPRGVPESITGKTKNFLMLFNGLRP